MTHITSCSIVKPKPTLALSTAGTEVNLPRVLILSTPVPSAHHTDLFLSAFRCQAAKGSSTTVEAPEIDLIDDDDENRYASSPRPFQVNDRSSAPDSQEDAVLLGLSMAVDHWLPPPTPPPPEAKRRRRRRPRKPSPSPTFPSPSCATQVVRNSARTPPPPYPRNRGAVDGKDNGRREESKEQEGGHHTRTRMGCSLERVDESGARGNGGKTMSTTRADGDENLDGQVREGTSQLPLDNRDRREAARKGGWARSCEGSAARRRADEVLARVAALELSFDRVEEETVGTSPTNSVRTAGGIRKDAANARGTESPAAAVASNMDSISGLDKVGEVLEVVGRKNFCTDNRSARPLCTFAAHIFLSKPSCKTFS